MKKYVPIVISFISLSLTAMTEHKRVPSEPISVPLNASPKYNPDKRHLHIVSDLYGRSIGNDGVSPTTYFELGSLASRYPHPTECLR